MRQKSQALETKVSHAGDFCLTQRGVAGDNCLLKVDVAREEGR